MSVNKAILLGRLGQDPEIRSTTGGTRIASFSLATSEKWRDKQTGEKKERTEWHRLVIFNEKLVEVVEAYLHKGDQVYLEGQIQTRKWTDKDGIERYTTEVVLQNFRSDLRLLGNKDGGNRPPPADSAEAYGTTKSAETPPPDDDLDDEIPF